MSQDWRTSQELMLGQDGVWKLRKEESAARTHLVSGDWC